MGESMTTAALLAALLSLVMEWAPKVRTWWEAQSETRKRGLMALGVAVITLATVGGNCWIYDACPADWVTTVKDVFLTFLVAAAVNQGTYGLLKRE